MILNSNDAEKKNKYGLLVIGGFILTAIIILSLGYWVNNKMEFYGRLINVAGEQRATTLSILSDTKGAMILYEEEYSRFESAKFSLFDEGKKIDSYFKVMSALKDYSKIYSLNKAKSEEINQEIDKVVEEMYIYISYIEAVMDNPTRAYEQGTYDLMIESSEICYEELDKLVFELEKNYDIFTLMQKYIIGICVFVLGLCSFSISYLLKKVKVIEYIAKYDNLTGVRNISYLADETRNFVEDGYALLFIDLNKFKLINDTFGHSIGDEILKEIGKRFKKELEGNLVFRYGGDEFVAFIKNENTDKLEEYIEKINNNVFSTVVDSNKRDHEITGSVGIIGKDVTKNSVEEAVKVADSIMYRSKDTAVVLYAKTDEEVKSILEGAGL